MRFIEITLDKPRRLYFTNESLLKIKPLLDEQQRRGASMETLFKIYLWAVLLPEDPNITFEETGALMEKHLPPGSTGNDLFDQLIKLAMAFTVETVSTVLGEAYTDLDIGSFSTLRNRGPKDN